MILALFKNEYSNLRVRRLGVSRVVNKNVSRWIEIKSRPVIVVLKLRVKYCRSKHIPDKYQELMPQPVPKFKDTSLIYKGKFERL